MAENNNRFFLNKDIVKLKKYFYVLRPVLACKYIIKHNSPPPILFSKLVETELPDYMQSDVKQLLDVKTNMPEIKEIKRVEKINEYLENEITDIKQILNDLLSEKNKPWDNLNNIFLSALDFK